MDIKDKAEGKLKNLYDAFFNAALKPIRSIYVDMELLQDLKMGAMLTFITLQEELEYIQHRIPIYNDRLDDECAKYFPLLEITEEQIIERMRDLKHMDTICTIAPFSSAYQALVKLLEGSAKHNDMTTTHLPIRIVVNVADLTYPEILKRQFANALNVYLKNVEVTFVAEKRYENNIYTECDVLMLYDIATFAGPNTDTANLLFSSGKFIDCKIFTTKRIGPGINIPEDKRQLAFDTTSAWINMFCDAFVYMVNELPFKPKVKKKDKSVPK